MPQTLRLVLLDPDGTVLDSAEVTRDDLADENRRFAGQTIASGLAAGPEPGE